MIPNRLRGDPPPDVLTGLVTQSDVNTNGRSDDVPYDNITDTLGTNIGATPIGAAGEGGYIPMKFNGINQAISLDISAAGFMNGGDFTFGCRASGTGVVESGVYSWSGGQGQLSLHLPQSGAGTTLAFVRNNAGQFISVFGLGAINDGVEHVLLGRYDDAAQSLEIWIDGVLNNTALGTYSPPATATAHTWAAFVDPVPFLFLLGDVYWSADWDRALTDEQMAYTFAVPNPFGRAA